MPKFILIDNSISDTVGHHYQYAAFCLQAAKDLGYEPILATNKNNKETENVPWKIHPVYTGTFWSHEEYHSFLVSLYNRFEKSKRKVALSGILRVLGPKLAKKLLNKNKIDEFEKNTGDLFRKISLSEGDIVFLPTSGLVEMFGVSKHTKNNPSLNKASWHFLFRRNLYTGSPENYSFMYIKLRLLKLAFDNFLKTSKIQAFFYTDSDQLTDQYDRIQSVKFHTLPIPHTVPKSEPKKHDNKLVITYLGDARTEKGYQYLPSVIQDLWLDYVKNNKVSFLIQSNYNIPDGEPAAVVARVQLQSFPSDKVQLVLNSPDLDEYRKILQSSNIILLPYDKTNYYARSSGILAEALALGIPVLVPSGTWLSRQFASEVYRYQFSLKEKLGVSKSDDVMHDIRYENGEKPADGKLTLDWKIPQVHCWLRFPLDCSFILVTIYFNKENTSSAMVVHSNQLNANKLSIFERSYFIEKVDLSYVMILIPVVSNAEKVWLGFKQPYTESVLSIDKIDITYLNPAMSNSNMPWSTVGIIYDSPDEISYNLKNMLDNYEHYLDTARKFSDDYYKKHNAKELVTKLIDISKTHGVANIR